MPTFSEQSYTVAISGLYDIVVAGAQGGRGAFIRTPSVGDGSPQSGGIVSMPGRANGGAGGGAVSGGGGGGATFLLNADKSPIAVGAGGGGASWTEDPGGAPHETMTSAQKLGPGQGGGATEDNDVTDSGGGGGGYQGGMGGLGRAHGLIGIAASAYGGTGGTNFSGSPLQASTTGSNPDDGYVTFLLVR